MAGEAPGAAGRGPRVSAGGEVSAVSGRQQARIGASRRVSGHCEGQSNCQDLASASTAAASVKGERGGGCPGTWAGGCGGLGSLSRGVPLKGALGSHGGLGTIWRGGGLLGPLWPGPPLLTLSSVLSWTVGQRRAIAEACRGQIRADTRLPTVWLDVFQDIRCL